MAASESPRSKITVPGLRARKQSSEKIFALTAYDHSFARVMDDAGTDLVLVGDSLGMVIQGKRSTLGVSMDDIVYHCKAVTSGITYGLVVADLPFLTYATVEQSLRNAALAMGQGGAQMVKLEGAGPMLESIHALAERDVPVCAHLGLTPQSVHRLGGFKVQGRDEKAALRLLADAHAVADAGADLLVLECVPADLAQRITQSVPIPTIGIGAGPHCDGQILVLHDVLGVSPGRRPRFIKNYLTGRDSIAAALRAYGDEVRDGRFPGPEHQY
jgi:3-methyl-2-oxobutanoate hydroxymethyltransferase